MKAIHTATKSSFWREQLRALRLYGTATVLCTIATAHAYRVHAQHLTPWKGGGFGMFSTIDSGGTRLAVLRIHADGLEYVGQIPGNEHWIDDLRLLTRLPSEGNLENALRRLAREKWMPSRQDENRPNSYEPTDDSDWLRSRSLGIWPSLTQARRSVLKPAAESTRPSMNLVLPDRLTLEIHRADFDLATGRAGRELITSAEIQGLSLETLAEEWGCTLEYLQALRSN